MAYDNRTGMSNPPVGDLEHRPSPWAQRDHFHHNPHSHHPPPPPPHQTHHRHTSSFQSIPPLHLLDPESEDSDVSDTDGDYGGTFSFPINLPQAPSKPALETQETITLHLKELERVEAHNVRKHERLKEKRARKDERIARKRAAQDEKIKAIMDARSRRDSRINQRRQRENIAFQRFYEELDEEETRLQTRLKRLKRGHLVEDPSGNRRISMNSMSPTTPSYSTVPPPSKRHQTSHPSHVEVPAPYQPPPPAQPPSYQFHPPPPAHHTPTSYHTTPQPAYQSPSYGRSPPVVSHNRIGSGIHDGPPKTTNGQMASPRLPAPTQTPTPAPVSMPAPSPASAPPSMPQPGPMSHPPPPRQPTATYDTRPPPPPPHASTFAAVNHPPSSGFAAVNSHHSAPPATPHTSSIKEEHPRHPSKSTDQTPVRTSSTDEKIPGGGSAANKRTPSTTHPYQMSEAFANRHHHCERVDSLNRGIWTWYGPQGTKDNPTATPTEMYLVCNHDECRRIDWRTVHGLQCHIVKNHDQPKGTIGSLEKALAAYGVPVRQIEEHERKHGPGSGGTMADPKNAKARPKNKDLPDKRDPSERGTPVPSQGPYHLSKQASRDSDSPRIMYSSSHIGGRKRSHSFDEKAPDNGLSRNPADSHKPTNVQQPPQPPQPRSVSGFPAVNAAWQHSQATPSKPSQPRDWSSNIVARPEKGLSSPTVHTPQTTGASAPFWPFQPGKSVSVTPPQSHKIVTPHSTIPPKPQNAPQDLTKPPGVSQENAASHQEKEASSETSGQTEVQAKTKASTPEPKPSIESKAGAAKPDNVDVQMTDVADEQAKKSSTTSSLMSPAGPRTPIASKEEETSLARHERSEADQQTPSPDDQAVITKEEPKDTKSPEMSHRRMTSSRRESRRSSMAATPSSKPIPDRLKEDDIEMSSATNTASKAESVDDDSDSITVNIVTDKRDRDRDSDRMKTPVRLPNGRFSRTRRMK